MTASICSASMSVDGFIAGPGGDMSWLAAHMAPNPIVVKMVARTGADRTGQAIATAMTMSGEFDGAAAYPLLRAPSASTRVQRRR